jgi:general L-amino acid transport system permease protein
MSRMAWKGLALQTAVGLGLALLFFWLVRNTQANLAARGLGSGYDFLLDPAGFAIAEGVMPYQIGDSYLRAFLAGAANTLMVAIPAVMLTTLVGAILGIGAIAPNPLLRGVIQVYVDGARNIPLLVHVLIWYAILVQTLPDPRVPLSLGPIFLSKGGLFLPHPLTGEVPVMGRFGLIGGLQISPEFTALVMALMTYTAAYCAEIVRAGLLAVPKGQWEAAHALILTRAQTIRRVVMPQALRVILPPYISLVLNTIKNSSLGVAIGYPEIVSIGTTSLNQSGRAIECISIIALIYLILNIVSSFMLSLVNQRVQIKER